MRLLFFAVLYLINIATLAQFRCIPCQLPCFQFIQDPLDYIPMIHHTNIDRYEYVPEEDLKYNAAVVAYLVYQISNMDDNLPRKKFNTPAPSTEGNALFTIKGYENAKNVQLIGTFNNWNLFGTSLYKTKNGWECRIPLEKGTYLYKFYIDGDFIADPKTPVSKLLSDGKGHGGPTQIIVK